jgi:signal transduction histidine kinase/CheY-like chemotaxis protein
MSWAVALSVLSYLVSVLLMGRAEGAFWVDVPLGLLFVTWSLLVTAGHAQLAARFVGWAGLVTAFGIAAISGGTRSPVLMLVLVLLSYVECFLDRTDAMRIVGLCLAGLIGVGTMEALGCLPESLYTHNSVERALIGGVSMVLTAVLLVGRWDDRSRTLSRLQRSTESLKAVNAVLSSTRAEALARARQQEVLARMTVDAFSLAPNLEGPDSTELNALITRCCAVTYTELGDGWVCLRRTEDNGIVSMFGQPRLPGRAYDGRRWPVHVQGRIWGELFIEARCLVGQPAGLSANDSLFVDGLVSLISAAVGRVQTARVLREKESQLRQAQRFERVAYKASGVVHDLNNALTCILQNAELAREQVEEHGSVSEELDGIVRAVMGATSISRQLLRTAGEPESAMAGRVRLPLIVKEELRSHGVALGTDIHLDCDISGFDGWVPLSQGAARQVLMNLMVNARQAMPDGGFLQIELGPSVSAAGQPEVELRVADTGTGIPDDVLPRIFDPMFTTKKGAGGTGLGLATVHSIVTEAGGRIEVFSVEGEGTTFTIRLPLLPGVFGVDEAIEEEWAAARGATILVVNDDARVRATTLRSLARFGYRVIEASSREEALRVVHQQSEKVDLLLTELSASLPDGQELARMVREAGVALPMVLVASSEDPSTELESELGDTRRLVKPITPGQLVSNIESLLAPRRQHPHGTDWLQTG